MDGSGVKRETTIATSNATRKPGVAGCMSHIPEGPPSMYHHIEASAVPATMDEAAPQKLNLRQYNASIVTGPKAAPIPPHG